MTEPAFRGRPLLAPLWHTALLIFILLAIAAYGAITGPNAPAVRTASAVPLYVGLLLAQWGLWRFATAPIRKRTGRSWRELLGERWSGPKDVLRDVLIALVVWAVWTFAEGALMSRLGGDTAKSVQALLPRTPPEIALWVVLSLTAGFCEETVFRGYLQKQFEGISGSARIGVALQAVIFGLSHGYQGLRNVILITVFGALFGALALWRKSLKPGMILHAWTDLFSGIFGSRV